MDGRGGERASDGACDPVDECVNPSDSWKCGGCGGMSRDVVLSGKRDRPSGDGTGRNRSSVRGGEHSSGRSNEGGKRRKRGSADKCLYRYGDKNGGGCESRNEGDRCGNEYSATYGDAHDIEEGDEHDGKCDSNNVTVHRLIALFS